MTSIERIRREMSITRAWRILGLPGTPRVARDIKSPFRQDKKPSFQIYQAKDGHQRWFDHGSASGGDCIDFWVAAKGVSSPEAIKEIMAYLGDPASVPVKAINSPPEPSKASDGIRWPPDIREPRDDECRALGSLRGLSPEAFFLAGRLGTLKVATVYRQKSWIITDAIGRCAEARRFDGQPFTINNKERKGFCLPGSKKDLPLGIKTQRPEFDQLKNILLVEGQPDYYAALSIALDSELNFRPATMLGAGISVGPEAREYFRGVNVLIIPHNDRRNHGEAAAQRWSKEINALGATKVFIQRLPVVCNDLNDFLVQRPSEGAKLLTGFHDGPSPGNK